MASSKKTSPAGRADLHKAILECSRDLHTLVDSTGMILYQSPSIAEMLGWQAGEIEGSNVLDYAHEDDREAMRREFANVLKHPEQPRRVMLSMRCKDGGWQDLDSYIRNELENPALGGILIETRDVVVGPELHRGLQNSEHLFRTIVSHPSIMIWAIDNAGAITVSEGAGLKLLGVSPGMLVGENVFELYAELPTALGYIRRALAGETLEYTTVIPAPGGDLTVDNRLRPQFSERGTVVGVTAITFEVDDRVQLEHKLRRAETMEAIGMLVGGVAHDFNNLLTAIIGFATVAKRADDTTRAEYLGHVIESADRGASLVRQLLAFARKDEIRPETVNLRQLLDSSMPLFRQVVGEAVTIDLRIETDEQCHIQIDRSKLEQVVLNLIANARDAMPGGGSLELHLSNTDDVHGNRMAQVEVIDNGEGMDDATLKCVFDPFFSTKQRGSGLGLATAHSIVSRAGGSLSVESVLGKGTTFTLRFQCESEAEAPPLPMPGDDSAKTNTARVLLVDDDPDVLLVTALSLRASGYEVGTASCGQEAYDTYLAAPGAFDIIVTDMTMPGMKGDELARLLRDSDCVIPILCVSGYHNHSDLLTNLSGVSMLSKPYMGDELVDKIAAMLEAS